MKVIEGIYSLKHLDLVSINHCNNSTLLISLSNFNPTHSTSTTVRYGTRLATTAILYNNDEDHVYESPPLPMYDTCPNNTVQCDGIRDCQLGTDEFNCGERAHGHTSTHTDLTSTRLMHGQMVKKYGQTLESKKRKPLS